MPAANPSTAEQHRLAFEAYYSSRNMAEAARVANVSYQTPFKWAADTYVCPHSCPYHNYHALVAERERVASAQLHAWEEGKIDPISQGLAVTTPQEAVSPLSAAERRKAAILGIAKSDIERLAQLELLYNKIFYELTGIPLAYQNHLDPNGITFNPDDGVHSHSMKECVNALTSIMDQIDKVKVRAGLVDEKGRSRREEDLIKEDEKDAKRLELSDLRDLKEKLENTSPEEFAAMRAILQSEQFAMGEA